MTSRALRPTGQAAAEVELLAQLGLPASASPEDVDQLHQAVSEFLAAAPAEVRAWARAQVAALDSTYIALTDPAGLEGSALKSPARPPVVVPGGPATPPARRGPAPAVAPAATGVSGVAPAAGATDDDLDIDGEPDAEDLAALYAMVTPSAHEDMLPDAKRQKAKAQPRRLQAQPATPPLPVAHAVAAPAASTGNAWKVVALATLSIGAVAVLLLGGVWLFNRTTVAAPDASLSADASAGVPVVDMAKVGQLMQKLQANPDDVDALLSLGTEYYAGGDMATAGTWFDKVLALNPKHVDALLARGAVYFNVQDLANAEATWKKVVAIEPDNVEVHYDLGFLYLNQASPNWDGVKTEWNRVVALDPTSDLAKTVQSHLASLESSSMIPAASAGASAASGAPAASPAASTAPGASAAPSAPTASAAPASPQAGTGAGTATVDVTAVNLAFTTASLSAPANAPFTIRFQNQDVGLPHDVQLIDGTGKVVFKGDLVTGATTVDYRVPALAAGRYTFTCSIHPAMTGTLTVGG